MLIGLLIAYIFSWFGFITTFQIFMLEIFNLKVTTPTYYFTFALLGFIYNCVKKNQETEINIDDEIEVK